MEVTLEKDYDSPEKKIIRISLTPIESASLIDLLSTQNEENNLDLGLQAFLYHLNIVHGQWIQETSEEIKEKK